MKKKDYSIEVILIITFTLSIFALLDPHFTYEEKRHIQVVDACYPPEIPTTFGRCRFDATGRTNVTYKCPEMINPSLCSLKSCWIVGEGACNVEYWSDDLKFKFGILR